MTIDERKAQVLRAVVEEYVTSAQPVGSKRIAQSRDLGVSAATIRNDMSILERDGFITQPHTSAGRIPTDAGYRYYVDHFTEDRVLPRPLRREVAGFFGTTVRAMEELLHDTSLLLARLTDHAAVVVGPGATVGRIRSVQLVRLQPEALMVVVVLSDGVVEKQVLPVAEDLEDATVDRAGALIAGAWHDRTLAELGRPEARPAAAADAGRDVPPAAVELADRAASALAARAGDHAAEPVYVGGASRIAAEHDAFSSGASAARLLELLEQHVVMVSVLRELLGPGLTIRIGSENEHDDLRECSIVLAPYLVEGEPAGTVGVLGPTRMDYRQASAAVDAVSAQLGRQLTG